MCLVAYVAACQVGAQMPWQRAAHLATQIEARSVIVRERTLSGIAGDPHEDRHA